MYKIIKLIITIPIKVLMICAIPIVSVFFIALCENWDEYKWIMREWIYDFILDKE